MHSHFRVRDSVTPEDDGGSRDGFSQDVFISARATEGSVSFSLGATQPGDLSLLVRASGANEPGIDRAHLISLAVHLRTWRPRVVHPRCRVLVELLTVGSCGMEAGGASSSSSSSSSSSPSSSPFYFHFTSFSHHFRAVCCRHSVSPSLGVSSFTSLSCLYTVSGLVAESQRDEGRAGRSREEQGDSEVV
ncbi:unnamed protein product [Pleuronectes platessa]|uniref:Uncharacterized protein n=1 Tax=Pleuronectes platessa TaxID=8262 RepID=A0A9N7YFH0_PLEPL|nr:unnamed protein product [Pleuronectes platessa]